MNSSGPFLERRKSRSRAHEGRYKMLRRLYVKEFVEAIIGALIVALVLRVFIISVYRIPSDSMAPTLIPGDFIVAWKNSYGVQIPFSKEKIGPRDPVRGEVVVFHLPDDETLFVKRVVGVAGDRIEIRDGRLSVNDVVTVTSVSTTDDWEVASETSGASTHRVMKRRTSEEADFLAPLIVPPGQVFLMGDFRSQSADSRQWGPLPTALVTARASFVAFSVPITGVTSVLPTDVLEQSRMARLFKGIE